ncbi:MAG TPA: SurA N-terminal domain-containing protein [Rhodanobacteraceae bacterium]|nr:SurA N-terminal domain-containing protein [Rhodanobacteraceae bacterium]
MLQKLREHTSGWIAKIILGMLVFAFSFFGIESYFMTQADTSVATVGGRPVAQQDFQNRMNQLRQQAQANPAQLNPDDLDKPEFRAKVLDGLINQQLLLKANEDLGLVVGSNAIAQEIAAIPAFQLNGKFDADTYKAVLAQQGMTPLGFQQKVKDDLAMRLLPTAVQGSALAPAYEVDAYLALRDQTRDVRYMDIPAPAASSGTIGAADIDAYYKAHAADFMNPETVSIDYIELKADDMKTDAVPDEDAIKARYEQEKHRFVSPEQRLVSHILVQVPANATPAQQKAALAKAEGIEKQLAGGADFATVAKQDSDDLGSKRQGGDLGWIEPGMTDKAFDGAVFGMAKGKVSQPVLSPEGYHIIWLRDVRPGSTKALAEVKPELIKELLGSERERAFNDTAGKLTDLLYSNPSSLQPAVDKLGLTVKQAGPFTRQGGASGVAANKDVIAAAFSDQVLVRGQNSDAINLGPNDLLVLRVARHQTATPKPLAEVSDTIKLRITMERREQAAKAQADTLLANLRKGESLDAIAAAHKLTVKTLAGLSRMDNKLLPQMVQEIFKMPHPAAKTPSSALVELGNGDFSLVVLDGVHDGDPSKAPEAEHKAIASQLQNLRGSAAMQGMLEVLRAHTKVEVHEKNMGNNELQ